MDKSSKSNPDIPNNRQKIGGFKWGHNTCGCGHGAHCHLSYNDGLCMYSLLEANKALKNKRSCQCDGYMPQAFWIDALWEEFKQHEV